MQADRQSRADASGAVGSCSGHRQYRAHAGHQQQQAREPHAATSSSPAPADRAHSWTITRRPMAACRDTASTNSAVEDEPEDAAPGAAEDFGGTQPVLNGIDHHRDVRQALAGSSTSHSGVAPCRAGDRACLSPSLKKERDGLALEPGDRLHRVEPVGAMQRAATLAVAVVTAAPARHRVEDRAVDRRPW